MCDLIDRDTNIFELWGVILGGQAVLYLGVRRGPDSSGHCDLFGVIFWAVRECRMTNEPLKKKNKSLKTQTDENLGFGVFNTSL